MNSWRKAFKLAQFELRESIVDIIFPIIFFVIFTIAFSFSTDVYFELNAIVVDVLFLIVFSFIPVWIRPKELQFQKINENGLWVSPTVMTQVLLPIPKDILVKSRLVISFVYSLPVYLFLLMTIYLFSQSMQEMMSFGLYIIFIIVWLSFYFTLGLPATDIGQQTSILKATLSLIVLLLSAVGVLTLFHFGLGFGIVHGSILLVKKWPFISAILAVLLMIATLSLSESYMIKQLKKIDYL